MQLKDYWSVVTKRWWVMALVALVAAGTAYGYSKLERPIYRATALVRLEPARLDWGLTMSGQAVMRQWAQLIRAAPILNKVNDELQLHQSLEQLKGQVSTAAVNEDLQIRIDVDHPDPRTAQRMAKSLALAYVEDQQVRMTAAEPRDRVNAALLEDPAAAKLNRPQTRLNVMAGAMLGLVVGAVLAFLLELLDDTLKTAEDVDRWVKVPTIGSIPLITAADARRTGEPAPRFRLSGGGKNGQPAAPVLPPREPVGAAESGRHEN